MDSNARLKRLQFRSGHRGCKETDLILGRFAETRMHALDAQMLDIYEQLLEENDADIWNWLVGKAPPKPEYAPLIALLAESWIAERE